MNNKNNIVKKTLVAGLVCVAFCGATLAAPHGGPGGGHAQAPAHHCAPRHHPAPPPPPHHGGHHHGGHHGGDNCGWFALGAAAVGGLIDGIIGACR